MYPPVFALAVLIIICFYLFSKSSTRNKHQTERRQEPHVGPALYAQQCIDSAEKVRKEGEPKRVDHRPFARGVSRKPTKQPGKRKHPNPTRSSVPQDSVPVSSD